jgi:hypothetical protein
MYIEGHFSWKEIIIMSRKLKIYEQSMGGGNYEPVPTIILKGQWLREAGFASGEYVEVVCEGDRITLTKTAAPESASKKSLEDKISGLSESQRKKKKKISKAIDALKED